MVLILDDGFDKRHKNLKGRTRDWPVKHRNSYLKPFGPKGVLQRLEKAEDILSRVPPMVDLQDCSLCHGWRCCSR